MSHRVWEGIEAQDNVQNSVGIWEGGNIELCIGLCVCIRKCEKQKWQRGDGEVLKLYERVSDGV